eukprot:CAMPEP_0119310298 /NCGR_PEP_ID=MMETSP1333-20130426/18677_1 /TAXON_ID=418940 /ORGANISM="Scyphosphaera apsteinii, Strain RCC1455" /LENGTH=197 /DNA_ID=CAMNT_0007314457 /DNA_START=122 /DNA_END=717 /DNA_ORIENTATION=+
MTTILWLVISAPQADQSALTSSAPQADQFAALIDQQAALTSSIIVMQKMHMTSLATLHMYGAWLSMLKMPQLAAAHVRHMHQPAQRKRAAVRSFGRGRVNVAAEKEMPAMPSSSAQAHQANKVPRTVAFRTTFTIIPAAVLAEARVRADSPYCRRACTSRRDAVRSSTRLALGRVAKGLAVARSKTNLMAVRHRCAT